MDDGVAQTFRDAMAGLASAVAVVTARREGGQPCGLVATSVASFSAEPPSVLASISHRSRCHNALITSDAFGVHVLAADQEQVAHVFADPGDDDKFGGVSWDWDGDVPRIAGALSFLHCRRSALFELYDHSLLVGDVSSGEVHGGQPLVYLDRRMGWRVEPSG